MMMVAALSFGRGGPCARAFNLILRKELLPPTLSCQATPKSRSKRTWTTIVKGLTSMQKMNRKINVQRGSLSAADLAFWAAAQRAKQKYAKTLQMLKASDGS